MVRAEARIPGCSPDSEKGGGLVGGSEKEALEPGCLGSPGCPQAQPITRCPAPSATTQGKAWSSRGH